MEPSIRETKCKMIPWKNLENFAKTEFVRSSYSTQEFYFPLAHSNHLYTFCQISSFSNIAPFPTPLTQNLTKASHTPPRAWPQRMEERARQTNAHAISQNSQNQLTNVIQQPPTQKHYKSFPVQSHPKHHVENLLSRRLTFTHTFILSIETVFYDPRYYLKTFMLGKSLGRQRE